MKKYFMLTFILLSMLACMAFPLSTPTPQVIYKSPDDMNLQPGDVPDLEEAPVSYKETDTYLPNSEGQS